MCRTAWLGGPCFETAAAAAAAAAATEAEVVLAERFCCAAAAAANEPQVGGTGIRNGTTGEAETEAFPLCRFGDEHTEVLLVYLFFDSCCCCFCCSLQADDIMLRICTAVSDSVIRFRMPGG